jgi:outer membrane protein TolC
MRIVRSLDSRELGRFGRMIAALTMGLVTSFGLLWAPPSHAAEPRPAGTANEATWTLERVLDAVRRDGPATRSAAAQGRAGEAAGASAWSALSPRVSFRAGLTRSDDPALLFSQRLWQGRFTSADFAIDALNQPGPRSAVEYGFVLDQPIWNGGAEITAPAMASRMRREARAASRAGIADALLDAVRRYVAYIGARERAASDSVGLAAASVAHASAVERHRLGQVPDLDTLRTFAREAESAERRLESLRERDVARRRLADVIGEAPSDDRIASPAAVDPTSFLSPAPTAPAAPNGAAPPELESARARADRFDLEASRAALRMLPSLNGRLSMTYYRDPDVSDQERRWFAGLSLDWPLWDGALRWNERRAAAARADGARADYDALRREFAAREEAARRDLEIAGPRRDAARAARGATDEALRLATARYGAGLLSLDDLLAVDADAARARERQIAVDADLQLAAYTYLHATGRLR